jgi:hypothetical protein
MLEVPVAFLIFNRPETTRRVFAEIAHAKPKKLLVIADGPRSEEEAKKCEAARAIIDQVDWDCDVLTNFSSVNLGCKLRVSSGLDWIFEQCEEAIILEDDCLPHPTFFLYCAELLEKYRDDERVMGISGNNFQFGISRGSYSYYFSCYAHIWGWASWRRAWRNYDVNMSQWPLLRETSWLQGILDDSAAVRHWREALDKNFEGQVDSWDIQWMFACWAHNALTVLPNVNLVSNIGFGVEATHTKNDIYEVAELPWGNLTLPLKHPPTIARNKDADDFTFNRVFSREVERPGLPRKIGRRLLASLPPLLKNYLVHRQVK